MKVRLGSLGITDTVRGLSYVSAMGRIAEQLVEENGSSMGPLNSINWSYIIHFTIQRAPIVGHHDVLPTLTPLRDHCDCYRRDCLGEVVQITSESAREIFIRSDSASIGVLGNSPAQQAHRLYECLVRILHQAGATMADVVLERVFFRNLMADIGAFCAVRRKAYRHSGVADSSWPLASFVGQPPCHPGQAFELQVYAVVPRSPSAAIVRTIPGAAGCPAAKLIQINGYQHLYIRGITGSNREGRPGRRFRDQSEAMFARAGQLLRSQGASFSNVLRTWCYLADMEQDYAEFNASRNHFFAREGVGRLPASTGIRAGLHPPGTQCALDLYALLNPAGARIEIMHAATLNEAPEYGSSFSRGMKVCLPEKTLLLVSGTASVDQTGATAHVGDLRGQIERMLLNVQQLLGPHGADFGDLVQVISYLKSAQHAELLRALLGEWRLTGLPHSIVEADICRPDLLCEMEAIAVLPPAQARPPRRATLLSQMQE